MNSSTRSGTRWGESMTEANQNFSKIVHMVDEAESMQDEALDAMARKVLERHRDAFLKLAE